MWTIGHTFISYHSSFAVHYVCMMYIKYLVLKKYNTLLFLIIHIWNCPDHWVINMLGVNFLSISLIFPQIMEKCRVSIFFFKHLLFTFIILFDYLVKKCNLSDIAKLTWGNESQAHYRVLCQRPVAPCHYAEIFKH